MENNPVRIVPNILRDYKNLLVSYETAILAKEKGFDWCSTYSYVHWPHESEFNGELLSQRWWQEDPNTIKAPPQSLLQNWLLETHGYYVYVLPEKNEWYYTVLKMSSEDAIAFAKSGECQDGDLWLNEEQIMTNITEEGASTPKEALEIGLQKTLNLL